MTHTPMAIFALLFALAAEAASPFSYRRVDVAPGIHAFIEPTGHAVVSGNIVAIVGEAGVAIVDSGHHPDLTRAIAAEIRALTTKPVQYVVNTHWHNDHVAGNAVFAREFPGARFVAHAFTAAAVEKEIRAFHGPACATYLGVQAKALREAQASGAGPDGLPLTQARRERFASIIADADAAIAECAQFELRGADLTFESRIVLRLGGRDVELLFLGRGNTAGDIVAHVPDARVVVVGDLLVHSFPFAFQGYGGEWARTLRSVEALAPVAIVPGHGPVQRDFGYLRLVAELLESIDSQVRAAYVPGMTLEALRPRLDLAAFKARMAAGDPRVEAYFDPMVAQPMVTRAWQAARGRLEPEGLLPP